jgi:cytochrome c553
MADGSSGSSRLLERGHRHHMNATDRRCGIHEARSILTLCATCHDEVENSGKVRVSGDANARSAESGRLSGVKVERATASGWRIEKWV